MIIGPGITFGGGIKVTSNYIDVAYNSDIEFLVAAGGGGPNQGGNGGYAVSPGAGGLVLGTTKFFNLLSSGSTVSIVVGIGGRYTTGTYSGSGTPSSPFIHNNTTTGVQGNNSSIGSIVAFGGGRGNISSPSSGGSGAGGTNAINGRTGGAATQISYPSYNATGYGNAGGYTGTTTPASGGGAGAVGPEYPATKSPPAYAVGVFSSITGTSIEYCRGGCFSGVTSNYPISGSAPTYVWNTTWGGGGWYTDPTTSDAAIRAQGGNNGIVILAYPSDAGLLYITGSTYTLDTTSRPNYNIYTFYEGSFTVAWAHGREINI